MEPEARVPRIMREAAGMERRWVEKVVSFGVVFEGDGDVDGGGEGEGGSVCNDC
jgi:hypothetical protein